MGTLSGNKRPPTVAATPAIGLDSHGGEHFLMNACRATGMLGTACLLAPKVSRRGIRSHAIVRRPAVATAPESSAADVAKPARFDVTREVGVCAPFGKPGDYVWDPYGETIDMDEDKFRWYRQAELKHGRVSMLAIAGLLNQHYWRFQGLHLQEFSGAGLGVAPNDFSNVPNGFAAVAGDGAIAGPYLGMLVILAGIIELRASDDGREPGDFGDPLDIGGMAGSAGTYDADWRNFELNHGRLAMFGIIGALAAEYQTGLDPFEQWGSVLSVA